MGRAPFFIEQSMQPMKNLPQLRPIPSALGLQPRFWSSFTFMCKWVYFGARGQTAPQRVAFVGPHPRVRLLAHRTLVKYSRTIYG